MMTLQKYLVALHIIFKECFPIWQRLHFPSILDVEKCEIPASTWAVFSGSGTGTSIQELEKRIMTEWFPTSGYEYANTPELEVYLDNDPVNMKYEVWIPVVKK